MLAVRLSLGSVVVLSLLACGGDIFGRDGKDGGDEEADADADGDADADADADADGDGDGDADADSDADTLSLDHERDSITTRETAVFVASAGGKDVTEDAEWTTDDRDVARVFTAGVVQPLLLGEVTVTATWKGQEVTASVTVTDIPAAESGDLVFNEVLADVPSGGDPNEDGTSDAVEDEFVEIANKGTATVRLDGFTLWDSDNDTARHTFATDTILRAGDAVVVFGGGVVSFSATHCDAVAADNTDSDLQHGLALSNDGDRILLKDATATTVASMAYDTEVSDASWLLWPELDGSDYIDHTEEGAEYSPCTLADGSIMPGVEDRYGG